MADISRLVVQENLYDIKDAIARQGVESLRRTVDGVIAQATDPTEGNAELLDIRVGFDGTSYTTAGAAVRGQVEHLDDRVGDIEATTANVRVLTKEQFDLSWAQALAETEE